MGHKFSNSKTEEYSQSLVPGGSRQVRQNRGDQPPGLLAGLHVAPGALSEVLQVDPGVGGRSCGLTPVTKDSTPLANLHRKVKLLDHLPELPQGRLVGHGTWDIGLGYTSNHPVTE